MTKTKLRIYKTREFWTTCQAHTDRATEFYEAFHSGEPIRGDWRGMAIVVQILRNTDDPVLDIRLRRVRVVKAKRSKVQTRARLVEVRFTGITMLREAMAEATVVIEKAFRKQLKKEVKKILRGQ